MTYFQYGVKEIAYLKQQDPQLGKVIDELGIIQRKVEKDPYISLLRIILSQQISNKALETVWQRFQNKFAPINATVLAKTEVATIQKIGTSHRKAGNIQSLSKRVSTGAINLQNLANLSDKEVINQLIQLPGIGKWSAEMFLLHTLKRPDILSYADFGIRKGLQRLHQIEQLDKIIFAKYQKKYSPYGSVASFYLWAVAAQDEIVTDFNESTKIS